MFGSILLLLVAVAVEVGATSMLPRTDGFREPWWTVLVVSGYAISLGLLAVVVRQVPVSVAYAIWAGLGTAAVAAIGMVFLGEPAGPVKIAAIAMIIAGVMLLNLNGAAH